MFTNPMIPVFEGLKATASGCTDGATGTYTETMFLADFPQFKDTLGASLVPQTMLTEFVNMANSSISPDTWGSAYRLAAGLYVAHHSALYLKTYNANGSASGAIAAADNVGVVKSATMGDTSVSYDNSAVTAGLEKWGAWNATPYGSQLVTMASTHGVAGAFIV